MGYSYLTPPEGQSPSADIESDSFFFNTYVPLSSLPTPPPSCHSRSGSNQLEPEALLLSPLLNQPLLGPSIHLTRLIPSAASLLDPCNETVHSILVRAKCPTPVLSLACGILDSLNSKFSVAWRRSLPLDQPKHSYIEANQSPLSQDHSPLITHIDQVRPEVILLGALVIATKFLNDEQAPTIHYAHVWAQNRWSCRMINVTEQLIMANLQYRILHLTNAAALKEAEEDMERSGYFARRNSGVLERMDEEMPKTRAPIFTNIQAQCSVFKKSNKTFAARRVLESYSGNIGLGLRIQEC